MKVVQTPHTETLLRTATDDNRRMILAWCDSLTNWEHDASLRELALKLPTQNDVYLLKITKELRLLFRLKADQIEIVDITTREAILSFAPLNPTQISTQPSGASR